MKDYVVNNNIVLRVSDLSKRYYYKCNDLCLFENVHFYLYEGESMSICGPSGCGKSTLLFNLGGLQTPTSGRVIFLGKPIYGKNSYIKGISYVFQHYHLIEEMTVIDNIMLPVRIQRYFITRKYRDQIIEILKLSHLLHRLPSTLSGGERQKVAIARALIVQPKLLLADEPTGSLDERSGQIVMNLLLQLCKDLKTTFVLVTHNISFAKMTKKIFYLDHGKKG